MRLRGSAKPKMIKIEPSQVKKDYVEIRLTENVEDVSHTDDSGNQVILFEYDEYIIEKHKDEIVYEDILNNFADWIDYARTQEYGKSAMSEIDMLKAKIAELEAELNK